MLLSGTICMSIKETGRWFFLICRLIVKEILIPYIPRNTLNVGLNYSKLLRNQWVDQFTASLQFNGTGKILWDELNEIETALLWHPECESRSKKGIFKIDIWSRNITDTQYSAFYFESFNKPYMQKGKPFRLERI